MDALLLIALLIGFILAAGAFEVLGTILLRRLINRAESATAGLKFKFHLSTLVILTLLVGALMHASISTGKDGRVSYVGWPLASRTPESIKVYSTTHGKMIERPHGEHTNWLNIALNVIGTVTGLLLIGVLVERISFR